MSFRDLDEHFLIVKGLDARTLATIKTAKFPIRPDDNAMLVYGYIDHEAGLSFELLCAAFVDEDGDVILEPANRTVACKFRYDSITGDASLFNDSNRLKLYKDRVSDFKKYYGVNEAIEAVRSFSAIDSSRAEGFPDDLLVYFISEGMKTEGIWGRLEDFDIGDKLFKLRILNEPYQSFGYHMGQMMTAQAVDVGNNEIKLVAVL